MSGYRTEDEALIALARQLTDAYGEARRREDQDFACDAIAQFLSEYRSSAPDEALLAILDLPLTAETYPLVDEAQTALAGRGPAVVELLLEASLGEVYDPDGPAPERAVETLEMMDRGDAVRGLVDVLCGRADDDVKGTAVDDLVTLGRFAEPALAGALDDPRGGDWARAALSQIRLEAKHSEALETYAAGEGTVSDDAGDLLAAAAGEADLGDAAQEGRAGDDEGPPEDTLEEAPDDPAEAPPVGPDQQTVDDAYEEFLRRYDRESEDGTSAS